MEQVKKKKQHRKVPVRKRILQLLVLLVLAAAAAFGLYVSRYYHADETARAALVSTDTVTVQKEKTYYLFDGPGEKTAYIFYPGAKVETESYAPLMQQIAESGIDVFLVDMPFHLAFFGMNRADAVIAENEEYDSWYIGGHSLGGAMAANYAAENPEKLDGAILMAAYPTKSLDSEDFQVISFYGSEDQVLNMEHFEEGRTFMPADYFEVKISGGNHAGFGNYGEQEGDGTASVSAQEQQRITADTIAEQLH